MIKGYVTADLQAWIPTELRGPNGKTVNVKAAVDTGFSSFIMLPQSQVNLLELPLVGSGKAALADGQIVPYESYEGTVLWGQEVRRVEVIASAGESLIGMQLLAGRRFMMDVAVGGAVQIEPLLETSHNQ